jgi:hypothetical protein
MGGKMDDPSADSDSKKEDRGTIIGSTGRITFSPPSPIAGESTEYG